MIPAPPSRRRLKIHEFAKQYPNVHKRQINDLKEEIRSVANTNQGTYTQQDASEFINLYLKSLSLPLIDVVIHTTHEFTYHKPIYTENEIYKDESDSKEKYDEILKPKIVSLNHDKNEAYDIQELINTNCFEITEMDLFQTYIKKKSYEMTHRENPNSSEYQRGQSLVMKSKNEIKNVIFLQMFNENKYVVKADGKAILVNKNAVHKAIEGIDVNKYVKGDKLILQDGRKVMFLESNQNEYIVLDNRDSKTTIKEEDIEEAYTFVGGQEVHVDRYKDISFEVKGQKDDYFIIRDTIHKSKTRTSERTIQSNGKYLFLYFRIAFNVNPENVFSTIELSDNTYHPIGMILRISGTSGESLVEQSTNCNNNGHYVALVKRNSWYFCSDTTIEKIDLKEYELRGNVMCLMYCTESNPHSDKPPRLDNYGNQCYMNAAIHFLMCMQDNFKT